MPRVRSITLHHAGVPLRSKIKHASHEREASDNLVVKVTLDDGQVGYGEGVPRSYVTGETIDTTFDALARVDVPRILDGSEGTFLDVACALSRWTLPEIADDPRGMFGNAARCALEMALLDAYGRSFGVPFGEAIEAVADAAGARRESPARVRYSGAITADSPRGEFRSAIKMRIYGFAHVKLKVGIAGQDDEARVRRCRRILGSRANLRVDANEAWTLDEFAGHVPHLAARKVSAVEQPLPHGRLEDLEDAGRRFATPVMLDESLCGIPDGRRVIELRAAKYFNIRLSKCGGIFPSLRLMEVAHSAGLGYQLGCHPGETGLLSAAGRAFASRLRGFLAVEGSYDRHVLARNIIREDVTFHYGGWAAPLPGPGLGVTVDPEALASLTVKSREVTYD